MTPRASVLLLMLLTSQTPVVVTGIERLAWDHVGPVGWFELSVDDSARAPIAATPAIGGYTNAVVCKAGSTLEWWTP